LREEGGWMKEIKARDMVDGLHALIWNRTKISCNCCKYGGDGGTKVGEAVGVI
jgi:hypothetical protein